MIVEPYGTLLRPETPEEGVALLKRIEAFGRVSHRSEGQQTSDSWQRFIEAVVLRHGDWSIVEHASAAVEFLVDRGMSHEIVRHRIASYTQESTRFVNYSKKVGLNFIRPNMTESQARAWEQGIRACERAYYEMLELGASPQIARSVLPNALATKLITTANLRSWRQILMSRTSVETHPQVRAVMCSLLDQFRARVPLLFDDIRPDERQAKALSRAR